MNEFRCWCERTPAQETIERSLICMHMAEKISWAFVSLQKLDINHVATHEIVMEISFK